jgi:hypothetical protein
MGRESIIDELKDHARALQRRVREGDRAALGRVRKLAELAKEDDASLAAQVKRRHALAVLAKELGFSGWPHARAVLAGESPEDFGTLLYPDGASAHWNIWSAHYDEARQIRGEHGGYLLAYRRHFFIVDRYFIETLGLDPDDPRWEDIGRDWVRPPRPEARTELYAELVRARLAAPVAASRAG